MRQAGDAMLLDTTHLAPDRAFDRALDFVNSGTT
jgi:hypothetical protein